MGHTRLGKIPKSRKWTAVVESIAGGGTASSPEISIGNVAKQTLEAAQGGLRAAIDDVGLQYTFYLLTQIALASRDKNFLSRLQRLGINLTEESSLQDLTTEMQIAIDEYVYSNGHITDISEMAQKAAGEALVSLAGNKAITLFGADAEDLRIAIHDLSTKVGFSHLGQRFFSVFISHFLNFYLSRITAPHVNGNKLNQVGDIIKFNEALRLHCEQSARIVYEFSGQWYSKTNFEKGIDLENTAGFIAVALKKLQAELKQQEVEDD
jgi:hypothetical protein